MKVSRPVQVQPSSLWLATAGQADTYPALSKDVQVATCIVGGGYTGLSTALHLAEHGHSCAVVDAHDVGWGASGRNGGQVIAGLKYGPEKLVEILGEDLGRRTIDTVGGAADTLFELVFKFSIHCHAAQNGWLQGAHCERAFAHQRARMKEWNDYGAETRLLDSREAASATGSTFYSGAWFDPRGGTIHPLLYARGLANAASRRGAHIFTNTPALSLSKCKAGWNIACERGTITADTVVLATNAYTDGLFPKLRRTVVPVTSIQIATRPLPDELRRVILPNGQALSETRHVLRYSRLDSEGRFIIGTQGPDRVDVTMSDAKSLIRDARIIFPLLADTPFEFVWSGHVAMTADHLPHLHVLEKGVYAGLGYNGRGVAMATTLGKLLARLASGEDPDALGFPVTSAQPIRLHRFAPVGAKLVSKYYDAFDRLKI